MKEKKTITQLARDLRKNQTASENLLWQNLRNRKLNGFKFNRQFPIVYGRNFDGTSLFFIADFYCHEKKLIIELDGKIHEFQKEYDKERDTILNKLGLSVIRIKNEELDKLSEVLGKIRNILSPNPSLEREGKIIVDNQG
ncbi:MAG: endonuclease domain-containing protein [Flavobacteriales bacterium]|nr:endonuclease domain-containing protein [Flavobacteriales bacterium]